MITWVFIKLYVISAWEFLVPDPNYDPSSSIWLWFVLRGDYPSYWVYEYPLPMLSWFSSFLEGLPPIWIWDMIMLELDLLLWTRVLFLWESNTNMVSYDCLDWGELIPSLPKYCCFFRKVLRSSPSSLVFIVLRDLSNWLDCLLSSYLFFFDSK